MNAYKWPKGIEMIKINHIFIQPINLFVIFFLQFNQQFSYADVINEQYIKDGVVYEFKAITKYDAKGLKMYDTGVITISSEEGELISMSRYGHSPIPGCKKVPPISSLNIPLLPGIEFGERQVKKTNFILFCGSYTGRHKTLRFYNPDFGFVSAIDFFDGPVELIKSDSGITIIINYKTYFSSVAKTVYYPIMFNLYSNILDIEMSADYSKKSKAFYAKKLQASIFRMKNSLSLSEHGHPSDLVRVLILSLLSKDKNNYCDVSKLINNNELYKIQEEIKEKLGNHFNFKMLEKMEC